MNATTLAMPRLEPGQKLCKRSISKIFPGLDSEKSNSIHFPNFPKPLRTLLTGLRSRVMNSTILSSAAVAWAGKTFDGLKNSLIPSGFLLSPAQLLLIVSLWTSCRWLRKFEVPPLYAKSRGGLHFVHVALSGPVFSKPEDQTTERCCFFHCELCKVQTVGAALAQYCLSTSNSYCHTIINYGQSAHYIACLWSKFGWDTSYSCSWLLLTCRPTMHAYTMVYIIIYIL